MCAIMTQARPELAVLGKLSNDKINELSEFFNESIVTQRPDVEKIKNIVGENFSDIEIKSIVSVFFNFFRSSDYQDKIFDIVDASDVGDKQKKEFVKETIKKIHAKIDPAKIELNAGSAFLKNFGHPHLHEVSVVPEFRPIMHEGKIVKFVPSLVINGTLHHSNPNNNEVTLNFQTDLNTASDFVDALNEEIKELKMQISELRNKFGDGVID